MSEISKCNRCGAPLTPDSPEGLCPRCLIAMNLATQTEIPGETGPAKPPPAPPLPVADVAKLFPQLEILECLGRGGMGAVYKARQPRLDRLVALKILSPEKQGNQKFAERFEREARALARLHHPNIVAVFDFGEVQGNFYLLMEFVDGLTLRQVLEDRQLTAAEALAIVPKICEALQYAHEQGIVHRDIKPENILMDKSGRLKIADLGIAKILGDGERTNLTEEQAIGTPHYMSPEQIEKPQTVDHRADIYSLGVVFYEMLTGELPLGKFQAPSKKVHIDVRLDEIVLRALEKEPDRRYQHASEIKTQVETITASASRGRYADDSPVPVPPVHKPDHFWRRFAVIVLLLISIPFVISILGLLAAIAIPNFVHARQHALELQQQRVISTSFAIGQTWFPQGDSIEITSVERTEDQMTVKGHYNLVSHDTASLAFYITSSNSTGFPEGGKQSIKISKGSDDFELIHPHLVVGLPHVSMYGEGGNSFAAIYFGDEQQAEEESKARWITNDASVETWAPTLAPGEKPDLQKILQDATDLMNQGKYEEALQRHLWYFNHALEYDQGQSGVRLTSALDSWVELGRRYPKARQALIEICNSDTQRILHDRGYFNLFMDVHGINQYLGDDDATYELFKSIEKSDPRLAAQCYFVVESALVNKGEYEICRKYMGDPQARFQSICNLYQMEMQNQARFAEMNQKNKQLTAAMNKQRGWTNTPVYSPPDTSAMMKKSAQDRFVGQVRQLIEILVATGNKDDAGDFQSQAVAILDDPRLKSAVSDAKAKIEQQGNAENVIPTLANQPPVVVETYPVSGARDVEPGETEIRVRFSKDMEDGSWSWSTAWENSTPDFIGSPHYDADSRTCVAKVKLEPGRNYAFWLNSDNFHNFKDKDGRPAVPYLLIFQAKPNRNQN